MTISVLVLGLFVWIAAPLYAQSTGSRALPQNSSISQASAFVTRSGAQLQLNGRPFYFAGANFYSAMVNAAGSESTRQQTTQIFETMQSLGLTVLRTWAFNDYGVNNTWQALQTAPQVFDERVFRDGLDWIINEAPKYDVKLLLTLTNYQKGYGGAYQYAKWANSSTITDFYTNPTITGWYKNNIKTIVTRVNSLNGLRYSNDPAIFGWELINEPHVAGDDTGSILTKWLDDNSAYLKTLDSNHLVGTGVEGFYGQSTPELLPDNPVPNLSAFANGGSPAPYAPICEGQDFFANHQPQGIDFTSVHLYPDAWASANLTFQMIFTQQFLQGHIAQSARLQKPLILGEFGKYPPLADRNKFFQFVYDVAAASAQSGGPFAGTMLWTLGTTPEFPYVQGFDAYNVYPTAAPYMQAAPQGYNRPTALAALNAQDTEFYGWAQSTTCNAKYVTNPRALLTNQLPASDGYQDTLSIIKRNVQLLSSSVASTVTNTTMG